MVNVLKEREKILEELWEIISINQDLEAQELYSKVLQSTDGEMTENQYKKYKELKKKYLKEKK